jgi:hypothetical protein
LLAEISGLALAAALTAIALRVAFPIAILRKVAVGAAILALPLVAASLAQQLIHARTVLPMPLLILVETQQGYGALILDPVQLLAIYLIAEALVARRAKHKNQDREPSH